LGYSDEGTFEKEGYDLKSFLSQAFSCQASSKPPYRNSDIDFLFELDLY